MPVYLNVIPAAKKQVDPVYTKKREVVGGQLRPTTPQRRMFKRRGNGRSGSGSETTGCSDLPAVEHVEGGLGRRRSGEVEPG